MKDMINHEPFWPDHPTVILANGSYPTNDIPLEILNGHGYLCCCDRAGLTAIEHGLKPDAIVGDGDSMPLSGQQALSGIFHRVDEQEYNDLTKATRFVLAQGRKQIVYLGATGLREDHTIANIALMATYRRKLGVEPIMATDYGWFSAHGQPRVQGVSGPTGQHPQLRLPQAQLEGAEMGRLPLRHPLARHAQRSRGADV